MKHKIFRYTILSVFLFLAFFGVKEVKAEEYTGQGICPSEFISNIFIKKFRDNGYIKYQQSRFLRRSEDNGFVYCLQPYVNEIDNNLPYYQIARKDYASVTDMTEEQWDKVALLAYYGYGYNVNGYDHTNSKWYAITQVLMWRVIEPTSKIIFTDTLNGKETKKFDDDIAELESLVANHYKRPDFGNSELVLSLGQSITLTDKNNVLNNFKISSTENATATITGNTITITSTGVGEAKVNLVKKASKYTEAPIVYYSNHSQNVMRVGYYDPIPANIKAKVIGGKVAIQKVDSETLRNYAQGDATLKGAVYGVFKEDGTKLTEITTDENGYAKSDYLSSIGKLYIQEIKQSNGYKIDSTKYYIELTNGNSEPTVQVKEEVIKGRIKIIKYDSETNACKAQGNATLKGAKYKILDSNEDIVDTITIGEDCTATSKYLPYGNYKVLEEKSSVGYYIDSKSYNVFVNGETTFNVTSKEEVIKGRIKINKVDNETNSCTVQGQATLVGAKFDIKDHNNNVVDAITIGEDCTATSKYLPYGKYTVVETKSPTGYYKNTEVFEQFISVKQDYSITVKEDIIKNFISILKQYDYVNGNTTFLNAEANIIFEIFYPDGKKYGEVKTDKNGYAALEIPYGVWKFHQANSSTGFEKNYDFYITVDENSELEQYYNILNNKISAYVQIVKKDSETGKTIAIPNVKFKIQNTDTKQYVSQYVGGKVYDNFMTDENGIFTTYLKLETGNYKLIEVESPKGYLLSKDGVEFTIGENTEYNYTTYGAIVVVEFKNTPIKGQVEIFKKGDKFVVEDGTFSYKDISLKDIKFNIYADEDIKSSDGNYLYYNKGDLVQTITTDENGYVKSKKLPLGKYYLVEVETKDNYVLDPKEYHFALIEKDNKTAIVYDTYKIYNYLKKGTLEFTKKDYSTSEPIPNVEFNIYTENDELIYSGKTDESGKITIKELVVGKYYIEEINSIEGYVSSNEKVYFEIKDNGEVIKAEMTNKKITSTLKITKVDEEEKLLSGVKFGIYDLEDKLIKEAITNDNGYFEVVLEYGKYYLKEIATKDCYVLSDEKIYFEVKEEGAIIEESIVNEYIVGTLEFTKTDLVNGDVIPNTLIEIYDSQDQLVFSGKTDKNGKVVVEKLRYGKYYILEKEAPEGYILNEERIHFEIKENGEIVKSEMTNTKIKSKINIHKVDSENNSLAGVVIGIYDLNDDLIGEYTTNEEGIIEVELEYGSYYYKEISTLENYILNNEKLYFNVEKDGEIIYSVLVNEMEEVEVPSTNLNKNYTKYIISTVIGLVGLGIIIYEKKKRK